MADQETKERHQEAKPQARRIPPPVPTLETQPFWDAAAQGKFLIKRCKACGEAHYYPRTYCPFCASGDTVWEQSKGEGALYTYSVMHRSPTGPYCIAYVTLDEGPAVLTNIIDCDFKTLKIGQRMRVKFTPTDGGPPAPTFTPA
jgi:uncharacterized OB-fold protein